MKRYIKAISYGLLTGVVIGSCTGCLFTGKREVSLDMNILGNTVKWKSKVDGEYEKNEPTP